jgi:flagellar L-ring protein precursor FlgH
MNYYQSTSVALALLCTLAGCAGIESRSHPAYAPMEPIVYTNPSEGETAGSLYKEQRGISLFADTRARAVGDIISVVLTESTLALT